MSNASPPISRTLLNDTFIEGKLETVAIGPSCCQCYVAVRCPACGKSEIVLCEVPRELKDKLIPQITKNVRIVRSGGKWGISKCVSV